MKLFNKIAFYLFIISLVFSYSKAATSTITPLDQCTDQGLTLCLSNICSKFGYCQTTDQKQGAVCWCKNDKESPMKNCSMAQWIDILNDGQFEIEKTAYCYGTSSYACREKKNDPICD